MTRPSFPWKVRTKTGAPPGRGSLVNEIVRVPNWLRNGLNLKGNEVPSDLELPTVQPTLDVYQDGWAVAEYRTTTSFITVASPADVAIAADPALTRRLLAISAQHNAAAVRHLLLRLTAPRGLDNVFVVYAAIPVGAAHPFPADLGSWDGIVPPGWQLDIINSDIVGGESMTPINAIYVEVPDGFHAPSL